MVYLILTAFAVAADQFFKYWIVQNIDLYGELPLIPGILHLTNVHNTGAAFSLLDNMRWPLTAISAVAVVFLFFYLFKCHLGKIGKYAIAAVLGGALGNLVDRIYLGYVVDMFAVEFINFAVFNIADCFITCGGILFCICYIRETLRSENGLRPRRMPELERLKKTQPEPAGSLPTDTVSEDKAPPAEGEITWAAGDTQPEEDARAD